MDATVVRDTLPGSLGDDGYGIGVSDDSTGKVKGQLTVKRCVVERNAAGGILGFGASATIEDTTVRDTGKDSISAGFGRGLDFYPHFDVGTIGGPLTVRRCLFERNTQAGLFVSVPDATIESIIVRGTRPGVSSGAAFGDGIVTIGNGLGPVAVTIRACLVTNNPRAGLSVFGASMNVETSNLTCNGFDVDLEHYLDVEPTITTGEANACGCAASGGLVGCHAQSTDLVPLPPASGKF